MSPRPPLALFSSPFLSSDPLNRLFRSMVTGVLVALLPSLTVRATFCQFASPLPYPVAAQTHFDQKYSARIRAPDPPHPNPWGSLSVVETAHRRKSGKFMGAACHVATQRYAYLARNRTTRQRAAIHRTPRKKSPLGASSSPLQRRFADGG